MRLMYRNLRYHLVITATIVLRIMCVLRLYYVPAVPWQTDCEIWIPIYFETALFCSKYRFNKNLILVRITIVIIIIEGLSFMTIFPLDNRIVVSTWVCVISD